MFVFSTILIQLALLYYNAEIKPNDTSEVCDPKCDPGQCCMNGTCLCFDSDTKKGVECEGLLKILCNFDTWVHS